MESLDNWNINIKSGRTGGILIRRIEGKILKSVAIKLILDSKLISFIISLFNQLEGYKNFDYTLASDCMDIKVNCTEGKMIVAFEIIKRNTYISSVMCKDGVLFHHAAASSNNMKRAIHCAKNKEKVFLVVINHKSILFRLYKSENGGFLSREFEIDFDISFFPVDDFEKFFPGCIYINQIRARKFINLRAVPKKDFDELISNFCSQFNKLLTNPISLKV